MRFKPPNPPMIQARHFGGHQTPTLVVMHSTVSPTAIGGARNIARMFAETERDASAHYTVDPVEVVQCVPDHRQAYHCGWNDDSLGIEMCDYPSRVNMLRWQGREHKRLLARTATLTAQLCLAYGIRRQFLGVKALRAWDAAGRPAHLGGITTHANMSAAFKKSTHWDPGRWPRVRFMRAVRAETTRLRGTR